MKENVFNIFYFSKDGNEITHAGIVMHTLEGDDESKIQYLLKNLEIDLASCRSFHAIHPSVLDSDGKLTIQRYHANMRISNSLAPFEIALEEQNAALHPVAVVTAVIDGKISYNAQLALDEKLRYTHMPDQHIEGVKALPDYLEQYIKDDGFHMKELLNDDHMEPIKLLFNKKHYLSSFKLLMSFIDTVAYLEYGNKKRVFQDWLDTYADLSGIEVTSEEIYGLRSSLLHMTNLNSHKVMQGKERRLSIAVCKRHYPTQIHNNVIYINYTDFLFIFDEAIDKWLDTYSDNKKQLTLIERYDEVIRDNY